MSHGAGRAGTGHIINTKPQGGPIFYASTHIIAARATYPGWTPTDSESTRAVSAAIYGCWCVRGAFAENEGREGERGVKLLYLTRVLSGSMHLRRGNRAPTGGRGVGLDRPEPSRRVAR